MTKDQRNRLPKSTLFRARWTKQSYFAKFRMANAMQVQIGHLTLIWRMPWLENSARRLYPEVFRA